MNNALKEAWESHRSKFERQELQGTGLIRYLLVVGKKPAGMDQTTFNERFDEAEKVEYIDVLNDDAFEQEKWHTDTRGVFVNRHRFYAPLAARFLMFGQSSPSEIKAWDHERDSTEETLRRTLGSNDWRDYDWLSYVLDWSLKSTGVKVAFDPIVSGHPSPVYPEDFLKAHENKQLEDGFYYLVLRDDIRVASATVISSLLRNSDSKTAPPIPHQEFQSVATELSPSEVADAIADIVAAAKTKSRPRSGSIGDQKVWAACGSLVTELYEHGYFGEAVRKRIKKNLARNNLASDEVKAMVAWCGLLGGVVANFKIGHEQLPDKSVEHLETVLGYLRTLPTKAATATETAIAASDGLPRTPQVDPDGKREPTPIEVRERFAEIKEFAAHLDGLKPIDDRKRYNAQRNKLRQWLIGGTNRSPFPDEYWSLLEKEKIDVVVRVKRWFKGNRKRTKQ